MTTAGDIRKGDIIRVWRGGRDNNGYVETNVLHSYRDGDYQIIKVDAPFHPILEIKADRQIVRVATGATDPMDAARAMPTTTVAERLIRTDAIRRALRAGR